jgi:hypothetical protein
MVSAFDIKSGEERKDFIHTQEVLNTSFFTKP